MNIRIPAALIFGFAASVVRADDTGRRIAEQGTRVLHEIRAEAARSLHEQLRDAIEPLAPAGRVQRSQLNATAQHEDAQFRTPRTTAS